VHLDIFKVKLIANWCTSELS